MQKSGIKFENNKYVKLNEITALTALTNKCHMLPEQNGVVETQLIMKQHRKYSTICNVPAKFR
jgi:hypothetical protein